MSAPGFRLSGSRSQPARCSGVFGKSPDAIRADKSDDGIVQANILGEKPQGTLKVTWLMPVEPGVITEW